MTKSLIHARLILWGVLVASIALAATGCDEYPWNTLFPSNDPQEEPAPSDDAALSDLEPSEGVLSPVFSPSVTGYSITVSYTVEELTVTAVSRHAAATITINGGGTDSGTPSPPVQLDVGRTEILIVVTAEDGTSTETYAVTVTRMEQPDTTPPTISLSGANPVHVEVHTAYSEPGYAATDAEEGDLTAAVVVTGTVNTSSLGEYTLFYDVSDGSGNAASPVSRTVVVEDTMAPTIELIGTATVAVAVDGTFADPGATVRDNYDADRQITASSGTVDTTTAGTYTLSYTAVDSEGNPATPVTRTVEVGSGLSIELQ
jgi:hypothetical protein